MTEIKIEKKEPVWPWILVAIIVVAILVLLYFFVFKKDNDDFDDSNQNNTEQIDTMDSRTNTAEGAAGWEDNQAGDSLTRGRASAGWDDNQVSDSLTGGSTKLTSAYLSSVEDESKLGADAAYTNNALVKLIDAVRAKANESQLNLDTDLKQVRKNTMKTSAGSTNTSSKQIKDAGDKIAAAMQSIQKEKYPQLSEDVKKVKNAVDHIDVQKKMDNQKEQVKAFFNKSSEVLKKMN